MPRLLCRRLLTKPSKWHSEINVKFLLRTALLVLLATAVYYRFARHNALKYYLFFGLWSVALLIYVFRYRKSPK